MRDQPGQLLRVEARVPAVDRLGRLHRSVTEGSAEVLGLLKRLGNGARLLSAGAGVGEPCILVLQWVRGDRLAVLAPDLLAEGQPQIYLQFELGTGRYFFSSRPLRGGGHEPLELALPDAIYEAERRENFRYLPGEEAIVPRRICLISRGAEATASVNDWSREGVGVELAAKDVSQLSFPAQLRHLDGSDEGWEGHAELRHSKSVGDRVRLGLRVSAVRNGLPIQIERVSASGVAAKGWRRIALEHEPPRSSLAGSGPARVRLVEYANDTGRPIKAIVNTTSRFRGGTAVVIPPSWGGTKERTLGLAATLIETFERADEPLMVIRFDGTNRRGESWVRPEFRKDGDESLAFTFSQAVRDILSTFHFVETNPSYAASKIVLVTFSLGAIDGRRAMAECTSDALAGWVSVVGVPDLQSGMRRISGGVDYVQGYLRGMRWGVQELLGVRTDIDRTGQDALENSLVFFDDARRDMAVVRNPVTWFHGRHDGWVDLERVDRLLSAGETTGRRLVELPCGHQMRSSRAAMRIFETVAAEVARIATGREVVPACPDVLAFARVERAERDRRKSADVNLEAFWRDYLLGSRHGLGIELMTATRAYQGFMADQIKLLDLPAGGLLADLGAGTGELARSISRRLPAEHALHVVAIDFVGEALERGRRRLADEVEAKGVAKLFSVSAQLGSASPERRIPLADSSVDGVVASLLLSYIAAPEFLLQEIRRVLRPMGRLVVSTMRRDADISKLYIDGVAELAPDRVSEHFGAYSDTEIEVFQRAFLNNAARLMRWEEEGRFRFWEEDEFERLIVEAGFCDVELVPSFGDPAQALIVRARAPR